MGAVKRKLETIEDFAARLPNGLLTSAELARRVVSTVDPVACDEVREYSVHVASLDDYWFAVVGTVDNPESAELINLGRFESGSPFEEEHLACAEALFNVPGIIIEID